MSIDQLLNFWVKKKQTNNKQTYFTNFIMKIFKANFFSGNNSLWGPLQETINDISLASTWQKSAYIEIYTNWPITYFVEYTEYVTQDCSDHKEVL